MKRLLVPHLAVWILGGALVRIAIVPPEACPPATPDEVHASAVAAGDWLVRGLDGQGRFVYGYDRDTDQENPDYNIVRHGGAVNSLYQLAAAGEPSYLEAADRSMGWLLDRAFEIDDWTTIAAPGRDARLGTVGFAIAALVERRSVTGDQRYDDLMRSLGRFILAQQEPDGSIRAFWDRVTGPVEGAYGPFATGEALWALVELENIFPGEGWWEAARPTFSYLADGRRELKEGYVARLPDHWAAYALEAAGPQRMDDELVGLAERLAGYFSLRLLIEAQRTGEGVNLAVRWYPGPPAGVGTAGEGMASLYRLARRTPELAHLVDDMREQMACAAGTMVERQVGPAEAAAEPIPSLADGAWFYRSYTQVDDQQHVISALLGAEDAMRDAPGGDA